MNRIKYQLLITIFSAALLAVATMASMQPLPDLTDIGRITKPQLLDRYGRPITVTYQNQWNLSDSLPLHNVPVLLQQAFINSEDRRFYEHHGVDWLARLNACRQNLLAGRAKRGASTITEQVVRMIHPRPRTIWSRWIEGFEARQLEEKESKAAILSWYLNQVPYAAQRRGVKQAARYYFDRDLDTLSVKETLALAVMVRAPAYLSPDKTESALSSLIANLAGRMRHEGSLTDMQLAAVEIQKLRPVAHTTLVDARHFARYVTDYLNAATTTATLRTTLDLDLQRTAQRILDQRLTHLRKRQVDNGAVLIIDHQTNAVLAWAVGHSGRTDLPGTAFDAVSTPRQPGSTLKPFVYAMALDRDWTAATLIDDSPLDEMVGLGLHTYHNYSRVHYGPVSLREALAGSLNVPAVKAVQYVGAEAYLRTLRDLGIRSLDQHPNLYGDGLVLGNGAVTLFELAQAYSVLAGKGLFTPLHCLLDDGQAGESRRVFSEEVASLMGNILSDPDARRIEFGELLHLPVQTAVKTGTSSGYHDAWSVGYDHRHLVCVWMGNMNNRPMDEITGSSGPALVLRALFTELNRHRPTAPLYFSRRLESHTVCIENGLLSDGRCAGRQEWFIPGRLPRQQNTDPPSFDIRRPSPGLQLAMDPRIPDAKEAFAFELNRNEGIVGIDWYVDGRKAGHSRTASFLWPMQRGEHLVQARILLAGQTAAIESREVNFIVK